MIKVKLYDSSKDDIEERREQRIILYSREDFFHIINGNIGDAEKQRPFQDEDFLRFIREIDRAEFVGGEDWYSIVTPYGRTNVTALCGGTQYALALIDNSRRGIYTDISNFSGYGEDIWSRLATAGTDILIAYDIQKIPGNYPEIPVLADYVIENYPYEGSTVEAYVRRHSLEDLHMEDGKYYTGVYLRGMEYHWYHDIGGLIAVAEKLVEKAGKRYCYPPREFSLGDFAKTLEDRYSDAFYAEESPLGCRLRCYLSEVPREPHVKYPINILVKKETGGRTVMYEVSSVKYPTYSETIMYNHLVEFGKREDEVFGIVLDTENFMERADAVRYALWGFRNFDTTIELYDGVRVLEEFIKAVKEPYESGNLYVKYRDFSGGNGGMKEERAGKHDSVV